MRRPLGRLELALRAKQSRKPFGGEDSCMCGGKRAFSFSRHDLPELCTSLSLTRIEGTGNAGCTLHPRSRVQRCTKKAHTSIQVQRRQSGIPCAMALRLMPCSPRRRIRLVTVAAGLMARRVRLDRTATDSLAPATGVGTTRFCRTRSASPRLRRDEAHRNYWQRRKQHRSSCVLLLAHGNRPASKLARQRCRVHRIPSRVRDDARSAPPRG
jgi:hypothetical protein